MNKKFLLLVMCTFAFCVHTAEDSYVVVPRQAGVIYKNENDQEIEYKVRDERGQNYQPGFLKKIIHMLAGQATTGFLCVFKVLHSMPFNVKKHLRILSGFTHNRKQKRNMYSRFIFNTLAQIYQEEQENKEQL